MNMQKSPASAKETDTEKRRRETAKQSAAFWANSQQPGLSGCLSFASGLSQRGSSCGASCGSTWSLISSIGLIQMSCKARQGSRTHGRADGQRQPVWRCLCLGNSCCCCSRLQFISNSSRSRSWSRSRSQRRRRNCSGEFCCVQSSVWVQEIDLHIQL